MGQSDKQDIRKKVDVTSDTSINLEQISINLGEGMGWHTTIISLFKNGQVNNSHFPRKAGIYNLTISYSDSLFYNEVLLYRLDPEYEKLSFSFYAEYDRVFCRINSIYAPELKKEVVLNKVTEEMKLIFETIDKEK